MPFELFIARYGLAAVCIGAGVEGETVVIAGGVLAHQALVGLPGVVAAGAFGSFVADQVFFSLGRHFRSRPYVRRTLAKPAAHRAIALLERHPNGFILAIRFLYGIRTLSPIAVGTSAVSRFRFMALNAVAAIVWATLFAILGYELGDGMKVVFQETRSYWRILGFGLAVLLISFLGLRIACGLYHRRCGRHVMVDAPGTAQASSFLPDYRNDKALRP